MASPLFLPAQRSANLAGWKTGSNKTVGLKKEVLWDKEKGVSTPIKNFSRTFFPCPVFYTFLYSTFS
jgi:hypothetical protein